MKRKMHCAHCGDRIESGEVYRTEHALYAGIDGRRAAFLAHYPACPSGEGIVGFFRSILDLFAK